MEWIDIKIRLPEKYKEVLCYRRQEGVDEIIISHLSWMLDNDPIWCDEVSDYTHWMPLPEAPTIWCDE